MKGVDEKFNMDGDELEDGLIEELEIIPEECTFDRKNPCNDAYQDYEFARNKLRYVVAAGETVLGRAMTELAAQPSPRVVEGCSAIIKTIMDATSQLLDMHGKIKKMDIIKEPEPDIEEGEGEGKSKAVTATIGDIIDSLEELDDEDETCDM